MEDFEALPLRPADRVLVLTALGERDIAHASWEHWQRLVELDDTDRASFAVLPAVSYNLDRHKVRHALEARLRGIYRYSWSQCQVTFRDLSFVHRTINAAGIRVVAHRGIPVTARYLGDLAAIPSDQVDLIVPIDDVERAAASLASHGWRPFGRIPPRNVRSAFRAQSFENPDRRRVVLRWHSLPPGTPIEHERALMDRAQSFSVQGTNLLILDPVDQLLLACVGLDELAPADHVRWFVETCSILRVIDPGIDHGTVVERADAVGLLPHCNAAFEAIRAVIGNELPWVRLPRLPQVNSNPQRASVPAPAKGRLRRLTRSAKAVWGDYKAACRSEGTPITALGFVRFTEAIYRHEWSVTTTRGLAWSAARRLWRRNESFVGRHD